MPARKTKWPPERVKALREAFNWTQEEMANALGVTLTSVNRWERGWRQVSRLAAMRLDMVAARLPENTANQDQ